MRDRRFYARGGYRMQGLIAWSVALLLLLGVSALFGRYSSDGNPLNFVGSIICGISAAALGWLGWQFLQPLCLELTSDGGRLVRFGRVLRRWRWTDADRIEWIQPSRGRFVTPEPFLVLKGYDDAGEDSRRFLVPLAPFSEIAYAAVRERLLMYGW